MNSIHILGTITRDIEIKYTQSNTAIASFTIAYNEKRKGQDGSYTDVAHFFDVVAFGRSAENINSFFRKGSRILIDGSLKQDTWKAQDGTNRSKVSILLRSFDFIDRKTDTQQPVSQHATQPVAQQQIPQQQAIPEVDINENEIPF